MRSDVMPHATPRRPSPRIALLALALLGAGAGLAGAQQRQPGPPPSIGSGTAVLPPEAPPQPPDGVWLTDEQGRQYFTTQVPKVEGHYRWVDDKTIVMRFGLQHEVVAQDDTTFTVKIYRTDGPGAAPEPPNRPTPEELARVAASYTPEAVDADRLSFAAFANGLPATGQWRNGFRLADMNGDGFLDIVHGPARKGERRQPNIFLGDGKGNWRPWREVKFPPLGYDYGDVAVADFNGDKRPDLALAVHLRGLLVLVADGPASFKEWGKGVYFEVPGTGGDSSGFTSRAVEAADWDRDGRVDLVLLGEGPRLTSVRMPDMKPASGYGVLVYLNQGGGSWKRQDELSSTKLVFGDDLEVADLNGDKRPDMVLALSVIGAKGILRIGGKGASWTEAELPDLRPAIFAGAVHVVDLDRDGRNDLAIGYMANELGTWRTGIDLFYARAKGKWERHTLAAEEGRRGIFALDGGDLDGDGRTDLVALTGEGEVWVFLGQRGGAFQREASAELPAATGCRGYDVELADLDGDRRDEVVAAFAGESSALLAPEKCLSGGSLQAWKAAPRSELAAAKKGS
jgi:hypothetical protein